VVWTWGARYEGSRNARETEFYCVRARSAATSTVQARIVVATPWRLLETIEQREGHLGRIAHVGPANVDHVTTGGALNVARGDFP
jgi:hypothetical protein